MPGRWLDYTHEGREGEGGYLKVVESEINQNMQSTRLEGSMSRLGQVWKI